MALVPINFDLLYEDLTNIVNCVEDLCDGGIAVEPEIRARFLEDTWESFRISIRRLNAHLNDGDVDLLEASEFARDILKIIYDHAGRLPINQADFTDHHHLYPGRIEGPMSFITNLKDVFKFGAPLIEEVERAREVVASMNEPRDKWIYDEKLSGKTHGEIRAGLKSRAEWEQLESDQAVGKVCDRYCERHGLELIRRRK